jgi:hypothetical protein
MLLPVFFGGVPVLVPFASLAGLAWRWVTVCAGQVRDEWWWWWLEAGLTLPRLRLCWGGVVREPV